MSFLQMTLANGLAWLLALAFAGAGVFNARGGAAVRAQFQRWGFPAWWNLMTATLELLSAALLAFPQARIFGLALAATVMIGAVATVAWRREYAHLPAAVALAALTGVETALVLLP